jgi:hypothetical protein
MHLVQQSDLHRPGWPRHDSFWQDLQLHWSYNGVPGRLWVPAWV